MAFLTHMKPGGNGLQLSEHLADPKTVKETPKNQASKGKSDQIKDEMTSLCAAATRHLALMRQMCYVCATVNINRVGLVVSKQFYVDEQCREFSELGLK